MTERAMTSPASNARSETARLHQWFLLMAVLAAALGASRNATAGEPPACEGTIHADVVVFDNPTVFNRLGAQNPNWITYALKRDVVDATTEVPCSMAACTAGNVKLRPDKRPRPLVIRSIEGYCLDVTFTNLLAPVANPNNPPVLINNDQVAGRCAGFHATGTELRNIDDDGSLVGNNHPFADVAANCASGDQKGSLVGPDQWTTYHLYTPREGAFVINSYGATLGSEGNAGNLGLGMFGALNVEPKGARIYRSQVTEEEFRLATAKNLDGTIKTVPSDCAAGDVKGIDCNRGGQPIVDYEARYPDAAPWSNEGKGDLPVLNMLDYNATDGVYELVHGDINAIIVGPNDDGSFPGHTYPLESANSGKVNPTLPNRLEPFREFTSIYHDEQANSQVFPRWYNDPVLGYTLAGVKDAFMINYGSGGIGSEIIANRLHTGPMHDCTDCAYEEFFLSSSTVGDPGLLVNYPANTNIEACDPGNILSADCWRQFGDANPADPDDPANVNGGLPIGANPPIPGNYALFQEDPSNVHHAYTGDFTKVRNTHAGAFEQHIFHIHNHQFLFNPNDDNANYLDAQEIMPGSGHTYELVNGGAGNRNKTAGDAIFHCHFYPHFAQGMWYHIRIMDVMETGSLLAVSDGTLDFNNDGTPDAGDINGDGFHDIPFDLRIGKPALEARALPDGELPDGVPIPAIVPLPGKGMPPMPARVRVKAVDRGDFGVLSGRRPPNGLGQGPDSAQAYVDMSTVVGEDTMAGTADDISPGFPFWLAGNSCGADADYATDHCPEGIVGQRMPTPPLDMLTEFGATEAGYHASQAGGWDGGLPRHALRGYTSGGVSLDTQNRLDFRKVVEIAQPVYFPETGTPLEKTSMAFQGSKRERPSAANDLLGTGTTAAHFTQNGAPAVPGGPFNDPCVDDTGMPTSAADGLWFGADGTPSVLGTSEFTSDNPRTYRIANIQIDAVFNKVGYHYPQERIIALWGDVASLIEQEKPPQPLVMRFNTFDCGKLLHTNLVPHEFELDDFQVRTPTDIIGQHIHLPKWDLTTNDGAANGWNYEDGALAPGIVQERVKAINNFNKLAGDSHNLVTVLLSLGFEETDFPADLLAAIENHTIDLSGLDPVPTIDTGDAGAGDPELTGDFCLDAAGVPTECAGEGIDNKYKYANGLTQLKALPHPYFGNGEPINGHHEYAGARTVIQRMLIDPVLNLDEVDRGLGLTFSHDHYGPSTFQQIGLYSTILAEPAGSTWRHNETGELLGQGPDGSGGRSISVRQVPLSTDPSTGLPTTVDVTDGGPTSWQAAIITADGAPVGAGNIPDHREFYFEMSDFQHAYEKDVWVGADARGKPLPPVPIDQPNYFDATTATAGVNSEGFDLTETWKQAVNPPLKLRVADPFPDVVTAKDSCPGGRPRPCAEAINIGHSSMWVVNYRNEPIGLRVFDPEKPGPDGKPGAQADGRAGDLAFAFATLDEDTPRAIPQLNTPFGDTPYPSAPYCSDGAGDGINCDRRPGDPFTPIMRAYERDEVKIKIQVGATEEQHQSTVHGLKWLSNGSGFGRSPNSGWRNFQSHGISEQFSLALPLNDDLGQRGNTVDYLYLSDATRDGVWSGTWGILRSYGSTQQDLWALPDAPRKNIQVVNRNNFNGVCPAVELDENGDPILYGSGRRKRPRELVPRHFEVVAVLANNVLPNDLGVVIPANLDGDSDGDGIGDNAGGPLNTAGGTLVYNRRSSLVPGICAVEVPEGEACPPGDVIQVDRTGPLNDPTAMLYVRLEDLAPRFIDGVSPDLIGAVAGVPGPDGIDDRCQDVEISEEGGVVTATSTLKLDRAECPVRLADDAPVEPLVLRANAGDCIEINLRNKLFDQAMGARAAAQEPVYSCEVEDILGVDEFGLEIVVGQQCAAGSLEPVFDREAAEEALATGWLVFADATQVPALAGDPLGNVTFQQVPDLAGWQDTFWVVNRDLFNPVRPAEMHFFNNNLVRPSSYVGIHPQLVEYDVSRDDGVVVGVNSPSGVMPVGAQRTFRYYAGHIETAMVDEDSSTRRYKLKPTPIEFGGTNLLSADRVKQPQKGMFGALIIEPVGATFPDALADLDDVPDGQGAGDATRKTRAQVSVDRTDPDWAGIGGPYREAALIGHKITNLRWQDGTAIANIHQGELGREGAEDSGHAGFNYGMEPSWFRFGLQPDAPFGNATAPNSFGQLPNVHAFYANQLANDPLDNAIPAIPFVSALGDPVTPVIRAEAGKPARIHLLNGASADRDGTFVLHGHLWQRDPYVCRSDWQDDTGYYLEGRCDPDAIGSQALGLNPVGKWMGSEEGMGHAYGHWPILFEAGGSFHVQGDFLYRDYSPSGNRNGQFGLLRVVESLDNGGNNDGGGGQQDKPKGRKK